MKKNANRENGQTKLAEKVISIFDIDKTKIVFPFLMKFKTSF